MVLISQEEALAWVDEQLAQAGYRRAADPEVARKTTWSLVWCIEIDREPVYFKAASDSLRHEAAITQALASAWPLISGSSTKFGAE